MVSERGTARAALAERLVRDTGITDDQARELIATLGTDWSSLVREARMLKKAAVA